MTTLRQFSEKEVNYHAYQARQNFLREQHTIELELKAAQQEKAQTLLREQLALQREHDARQREHDARQREQTALQEMEAERREKEAALAEIARLTALHAGR